MHYPIEGTELIVLDIVCLRTYDDAVANWIAWLTQEEGESRTLCTHVGVMFDHHSISEQLWRNTLQWFEPNVDKRSVIIFRYTGGFPFFGAVSRIGTPFRLGGIGRARDYMQKVRGRTYAWWRILGHAMRGIAGWLGVKLKCRWLLRKSRHNTICSSHVGKVFERATGDKRFFGVHWADLTPDDIYDYCEQNPDKFIRIYDSRFINPKNA